MESDKWNGRVSHSLYNSTHYIIPYSCIYISGVPGTGKTTTVHRVLHDLYDSGHDFKFIEINGLKIKEPKKAYTSILKVNRKYTVLSVDSYRVFAWYCLFMYDKILIYSLSYTISGFNT